MKELIDRETAIKEIENEFAEVLTSHGYDSYEKADIFYQWYCDGLMKAIGILLDMEEEESRWIPCSERVPEDFGDYLVTKKVMWWNGEEGNLIDFAYFDNEGFHKAEDVLAWMPLPEPYEEVEQ